MDKKTLWLLVFVCAATVGNIYYNQPLLEEIARSFVCTPSQAGLVPTFTQIGYVLGLIFIAPLGDVVRRKRLLLILLVLASVTFLLCSLCSSFAVFLLLSVMTGLSAVHAQIIIPYVADLSLPEQRTANLGLILSASLIGILLSRAVSGLIGASLTWRGTYFFAAVVMMALFFILQWRLPQDQPQSRAAYLPLVASLGTLWWQSRDLRRIALFGAVVYAAFCEFWSALPFYFETQGLGPGYVGAFGIVGVFGALASIVVGRSLHQVSARRVLQMCVLCLLMAYTFLLVVGHSLPGFVVGVILLDLGAQAASVANQSEIYRLYAQARTRLNTIYKIYYFLGGALGTAVSTYAWQKFAWSGVCVSALGFLLIAFLINWKLSPRTGPG